MANIIDFTKKKREKEERLAENEKFEKKQLYKESIRKLSKEILDNSHSSKELETFLSLLLAIKGKNDLHNV